MPIDDGVRGARSGLTRADRALLGVVYAPVAPVGLAVVAGWLGLARAGADAAATAALAGLAAGVLVDVVGLRRWVRLGFAAPGGMLVGVLAFYALLTFAVFMGMPVPLLALGLVAGAFAGRGGRDVGRTRLVTVGGTALLAGVSAALALTGPSAVYDAEHILGATVLGLPVTQPVVVALTVLGVPLLLLAQWVVTGAGARIGAQRRTAPASSTSSRASSAETTSTVLVA